jgi:hypothetical protein
MALSTLQTIRVIDPRLCYARLGDEAEISGGDAADHLGFSDLQQDGAPFGQSLDRIARYGRDTEWGAVDHADAPERPPNAMLRGLIV